MAALHELGATQRGRVLWYRGHFDRSWKLQAAIWREYGRDDETNFTNRFCSRASSRRAHVPGYDEDAAWLSLMQHYGLPTRLLDWSRSPLIALYFALEPYLYGKVADDMAAEVWVLDPFLLNEAEGFERITPSIEARMCRPLLKPAFVRSVAEPGKVMAVMGTDLDIRLFVQQGCFTIHSDARPLEDREGWQSLLRKIVVPATAVRALAAEVDACGFRKGDLYPDLENLAKELKAGPKVGPRWKDEA
ncbi:MAG: FRG domain-containing protein [Parvibaculum sp.]|nr:FRG domain-containing protein [Parvibaculum sp.]